MRCSIPILTALTIFVAPPAAPPQQALQEHPPTAEELLIPAIAANVHGPVAPTPRASTIQIQVGGRPVPPGEFLIPVDPESPVRLSAIADPPDPSAPPADVRAVRLIRRTRHEELLWWSSLPDSLLPAAGGDVLFRPSSDGGLVRVEASMASLEVYRTNTATFSPDQAVPAPLTTAHAQVWLLGGVPFDRAGDGMLAGQSIGIYPNESAETTPAMVRDRAELYRPPSRFYRLDSTTGPLLVTPVRTLAQLHPQVFAADDAARHVPISDRLLRFMTAFEERLESKGLRANRLMVLRGFVSPTDRLRLQGTGENMAAFSRFLYGDAVALVYAEGEVPRMGDFDGNGTPDIQDVQALGDLAKETMDELKMFGGLGICARYPGAGPAKDLPYLHVDLRGYYAPFRE